MNKLDNIKNNVTDIVWDNVHKYTINIRDIVKKNILKNIKDNFNIWFNTRINILNVTKTVKNIQINNNPIHPIFNNIKNSFIKNLF